MNESMAYWIAIIWLSGFTGGVGAMALVMRVIFGRDRRRDQTERG